jgi:NADH dehydrogenase FAD-containing subunit
MTKHLVLLGSGPAHLRLLVRLAKQLLPGATTNVKITLISRNQQHIDSALSKAFVAGRMKSEDCLIDLEPLIQKTKTQWLEVQAVALDAKAQALLLSDGQEIRYDWLSINLEPTQDRERTELQLPGACANGLFVRPASVFCKLWPNVLELAATKALRVAVVCDYASTPDPVSRGQQEIAGIELAMAIHHALPHCAMTLITGGAPLAAASSTSLRRLLAKTLQAKKITVLADAVVAIQPGEIILASGASLACDVPVMATHAHPPAMAAASALALDTHGFVAVDAALRSTSHPNVLAAADVERQGDVMARTLTAMTGLPFVTPSDRRSKLFSGLQFVSSQDGQAIASWGGYSTRGRLAAWLKHRIDLARMDLYRAR